MGSQSEHGMRQRRQSNNGVKEHSFSSVTDERKRAITSNRFLNSFYAGIVILHVVAVLTFAVGYWFAASSLCTGIECEMTWSRFQFLLIEKDPSTSYGFYKFVDGRDPRQAKLINEHQRKGVLGNRGNWCGDRAAKHHVVLYIPGHWGSHSQARSLGAHGLQLTQRQHSIEYNKYVSHALISGQWSGNASAIENFVYDVYAVDFAQQGTALHASFVRSQSKFVARSIMNIVTTCDIASVTIVAHSIGGLVARSLPLWHPETRPYVRNIITLATPHAVLPYAVDESMHNLYQELRSERSRSDAVTVVSVSGGLRDEQIPPASCHTNVTNGITVLASNVMTPTSQQLGPALGMDHRAIVWCHNVLDVVRRLIFIMAASEQQQSSSDQGKLLHSIQNELGKVSNDAYLDSVKQLQNEFRTSQGILSVAMEAAMLYHLEFLLGLYALVSVLNHYFPWCWPAIPVVTWCFACAWSDHFELRHVSIAVLTLLANSLFHIVRHGSLLVISIATQQKRKSGRKPLIKSLIQLFCVWLASALVVKFGFAFVAANHEEDFLPWEAVFLLSNVVFLCALVLMALASPKTDPNLDASFIAMLVPSLPCLVAGKIILIAWNLPPKFVSPQDLHGMNWFVIQVIFPLVLRLVVTWCGAVYETLWTLQKGAASLLIIGFCGPAMMKTGGGYVVGYFIGIVAWMDTLLMLLGKFLARKAASTEKIK